MGDLRAGVELRVNEPPLGGNKQMITCYNCMFHAFQMYVAYVSFGCCKRRSSVVYVAMFIHVCCKCMFQMFQLRRMLQVVYLYAAYVALAIHARYKCMFSNVSVVFKCMLQVFYLDVVYVAVAIHVCCKCMFSNVSAVSNVCCKCFIWMLHMLQWSYTYVTNVCSKCFICF
jgi:hypothetical protein